MPLLSKYDDDYPTCEETHATFRVYREDLEPRRISNVLGLEPTGSQRRGERLQPPQGRPVPALIGGWFLSSEGAVASKDLRRHLDWLLEQLESLGIQLEQLRNDGHHMDVHCYWASAASHGGPTLSPTQMRRLADLDLDVWFDVYFLESPPADEAG